MSGGLAGSVALTFGSAVDLGFHSSVELGSELFELGFQSITSSAAAPPPGRRMGS